MLGADCERKDIASVIVADVIISMNDNFSMNHNFSMNNIFLGMGTYVLVC